jgi:hypothetical protein
MATTRQQVAQANQALTRALVVAATQGQRAPCSDLAIRDHWTSERETERRQAARWCIEWQCPVLTECGQAAEANDERWGVWGAVDRSVRPGKKLQRQSEAA